MDRRILALLGTILFGACNVGGNAEITKIAQDNPVVSAALAKWKSEGLPATGTEVITLTKWSSAMGSQAAYLVVFRFHRAHKPMVSDSPEGQIAVVARVRYGLFAKRKESGPLVDLIDDGTSRP